MERLQKAMAEAGVASRRRQKNLSFKGKLQLRQDCD